MNKTTENNIVYVVTAPQQPDTETVFVDVAAAETYGEWLVKNDFYDYYEIVQTEMN